MSKKIISVRCNSFSFDAEVADTFLKKALGLMFRKSLEKNQVMLFPFRNERIVSIWMFGMQFPLDVLWLNNEKRVIHIEKNTPPCRGFFCTPMRPRVKAQYVLEFPAGTADELYLHEGTVLSF